MPLVKSNTDIKSLRHAGQIAGNVLEQVFNTIEPGITTTMALEQVANRELAKNRATAPFKQFDGFGFALCISINDEIVNGPPSATRVIQAGDLVSIAIGTEYRGMHGKCARTRYIQAGPNAALPADIQRLLTGTEAIFKAIKSQTTVFTQLDDIAAALREHAQTHQLSIIDQSFSTGIGKKLHDAPIISHTPDESNTGKLEPGLAIVIMSMMTLSSSGKWHVADDQWTQVMDDNAPAAHFAETVFVTPEGLELLTRS